MDGDPAYYFFTRGKPYVILFSYTTFFLLYTTTVILSSIRVSTYEQPPISVV
jgi:hypothetical protein